MLGAAWIDVIRRIPAEIHDTICFATVSGSEIMAQSILRLDESFVVLRGRMGGTQDVGRIIVLPYTHIVNLAITKLLKDPEVEAMFGGAAPTFAPSVSGNAAEDGEASGTAASDGVSDLPASNGIPEAPAPAKPAQVSKTMLLARLRQRLADQSKQG